jgi:hypothetical protein
MISESVPWFNDGSTDKTEILASQAGALVINHDSPLRKFRRKHGSIIKAAQKIFATIQGIASIAVLFRDFAVTIKSFQWVYR